MIHGTERNAGQDLAAEVAAVKLVVLLAAQREGGLQTKHNGV